MTIADTLETLFSEPLVARPGLFTSADTGTVAPVRVILNQGEERVDFGRGGLISGRVIGEVLARDLANAGINQPKENDSLEVDGLRYRVRSHILLPPEALIWRLGLA